MNKLNRICLKRKKGKFREIKNIIIHSSLFEDYPLSAYSKIAINLFAQSRVTTDGHMCNIICNYLLGILKKNYSDKKIIVGANIEDGVLHIYAFSIEVTDSNNQLPAHSSKLTVFPYYTVNVNSNQNDIKNICHEYITLLSYCIPISILVGGSYINMCVQYYMQNIAINTVIKSSRPFNAHGKKSIDLTILVN